MVDVDMLAATVRQHQVGAFPLGDDAAIVKAQRLRRMLADQTDRLRQGEGVILGVGDAEYGIQQAGGIVVGRENVEYRNWWAVGSRSAPCTSCAAPPSGILPGCFCPAR